MLSKFQKICHHFFARIPNIIYRRAALPFCHTSEFGNKFDTFNHKS